MSIPVNIYIQSKDLADLIELYGRKLQQVKDRKKEVEKDEKEIRATLMQLKSKLGLLETPTDSPILYSININKQTYDRKWTWVQKIEFAIREGNRPLTTAEIVELLIIQEPSFEEDKRRSITSVSSILSMNAGTKEENKKFIKMQDNTGKSKYYLPEEEVEELSL